MKQYDAIVWPDDPNQPGSRITIFAENVQDAQKQIEERYGKGRTYTVSNEEEATRPR